MTNDYVFASHWRVEGTVGEVADVLGDFSGLTRWWPAVYLEAEQMQSPDSRGLGRRVRVVTKGWLPYTIRWEFETVGTNYPYGFSIVARGDFDGRGEWTFAQNGPWVDITYDWQIRAEKPLLKNLSFLLRPLFEANHRWAMARGQESLKLELARRRASSDDARSRIPAPPGPVTYAGISLVVGAVGVGVGLALLLRQTRRREKERRREV